MPIVEIRTAATAGTLINGRAIAGTPRSARHPTAPGISRTGDRYLESNRRWQAANAERIAEKQYGWKASLRKHGWTPDDYERVLAEQGGVCACCGSASPGKRLRKFCVDHDHATGTVRGLLCTSCNQGIGQLGDTLEGVEAAARYLRLTTGC